MFRCLFTNAWLTTKRDQNRIDLRVVKLYISWPRELSRKRLLLGRKLACHDDVIKWKHFPRNWPFARGIHRSPVNSTHKGQWRGALMFSLIWLNKRLSKQSWGWWFETLSRSLWRHRNVHRWCGEPIIQIKFWRIGQVMRMNFDRTARNLQVKDPRISFVSLSVCN